MFKVAKYLKLPNVWKYQMIEVTMRCLKNHKKDFKSQNIQSYQKFEVVYFMLDTIDI